MFRSRGGSTTKCRVADLSTIVVAGVARHSSRIEQSLVPAKTYYGDDASSFP